MSISEPTPISSVAGEISSSQRQLQVFKPLHIANSPILWFVLTNDIYILSALFVTKWIHNIEMQQDTIPPEAEEQKLLDQLKDSLDEMESPYVEGTSLAGAIARAWALFLTDVRRFPTFRHVDFGRPTAQYSSPLLVTTLSF